MLRRLGWTIAAVAMTAGCPPPKPACDDLCQQQQSFEAERDRLAEEHAVRRRELDEQTEQAERDLEHSKQQLAEARAEQARSEGSALKQVNEARVSVGLPAIARWSSDPGGLTPDGALLLFGGKDHKIYLGCLCDAAEPDSVTSTSGHFGPNGVQQESIWNRFSDYGSSYGDASPCSRLADHPPVVVSKDGQFYGYLTVDHFKDKAITVQAVLDWLNTVCNR